MNLSIDKIKKYFPEFNERAHDENDFWRIAQKTKTVVRVEPLLIEGYYEYKNRKHCILINSNLSYFEWLLTAFHELTHRILDAAWKKSNVLLKRDVEKLKQKQEQRAEDVALILLIPKQMLFDLQNTPFEEVNPFLQKYLPRRQEVFRKKGL